MRRTALEETDGFNADLIAGEEPDLCRRIRARGGLILNSLQYWRQLTIAKDVYKRQDSNCAVSSGGSGGLLLLGWLYQGLVEERVSLEFQTWSWLAAICSRERPVTTELGSDSVIAGEEAGRSKGSCSLMRSQFGLLALPPDLPCIRMRAHFPLSLVPWRMNLREPSRKPASTSGYAGCGSQVP